MQVKNRLRRLAMNFDQIYTFQLGTLIHHGFHSVSKVGTEAKRLGAGKALIVTDKGVRGAGLVDSVIKSMETERIPFEVFDEVEVDPGTGTVEKGVRLFKEKGCNLVIGVGGGSPLCAAKAVALMAANEGLLTDYEGHGKYKNPPLPVIAIPTTASAGTEVNHVFIITDEKRNYKMNIGGSEIFPKVAILDPLLLRKIPFWPAVNAGLDALTHAIEAFWSLASNPLTDCIALGAIGLIMENLAPMALSENLEAKSKQLLGSVMANIACGNAKLGIVHAMSQPLGVYHLAHGYANGILLPFGMEFNLPASEEKFASMAIAMGEDKTKCTRTELAERAIWRVKKLYLQLGFPKKLDEKQVSPKEIPEMVKRAMSRPWVHFNIRKFTEKDLAFLYEKAFQGWEL
jgi:alcohol dehydrogenase class IV